MKKLFLLSVITIIITAFYTSISLSQNYGSLTLKKAVVYDNGEGDAWPHGPEGSLYILIYEVNVACPGGKHKYKGYIKKLCLCGVHKTKGGCCGYEWKDGDSKVFDMELFQWRNENDAVKIVVYESDPGVGRKHDMIYCQTVRRKDTLNKELTIHELTRKAHSDALKNCKKRGVTVPNGNPSATLTFTTK